MVVVVVEVGVLYNGVQMDLLSYCIDTEFPGDTEAPCFDRAEGRGNELRGILACLSSQGWGCRHA